MITIRISNRIVEPLEDRINAERRVDYCVTCGILNALLNRLSNAVNNYRLRIQYGSHIIPHPVRNKGTYLSLFRMVIRLSQQTRYTEPMLVKCWATVYDVGPALSQRLLNVSCLSFNPLTLTTLKYFCINHENQRVFSI